MPSIAPPKASLKGRFELPVLAPLNYSLTDGTNIPPPPDSPIEEKTPVSDPKVEAQDVSTVVDGLPSNGNGIHNNTTIVTADGYSGRGRTTNGPTSPSSISRPSSIRRFLSRKSLHSNYKNGTNGNISEENLSPDGFRPDSPSGFSTATAKKRSSSWFRRFTGGLESSNKRTSIVYEEKPHGPPPPKLPELNQLKAKVVDDEGSLGAEDMFKNIK
jgi:hypothetical protein